MEYIAVTGAQVREARRLLGWSATRLSSLSKVYRGAIYTFEKTGAMPQSMFSRTNPVDRLANVRAVLEAQGVVFTEGDVPGVKLRKAERANSLPADTFNWARESPVAVCERHISEGEARVAHQETILAALEQGGQIGPIVELARASLAAMRESVRLAHVHLNRELAKVADATFTEENGGSPGVRP